MEAIGETALSENTSKTTRPEETTDLKDACQSIEPVVETIVGKIVNFTEAKNGGDNAEPEVS